MYSVNCDSVTRWWAACVVCSGQWQVGEGISLIYGGMNGNCRDLLGINKVGQEGKKSLWKMVGMNSLVWDVFAEFMYCCVRNFYVILFQYLLSSIYCNCVVCRSQMINDI